MERIEPCTEAEAEDRLTEAVRIAKVASPAMADYFGRRKRGRRTTYLHCPVENLFIVCMPDRDGGLGVLTVYRAEVRAVV
jgi:hypothetical protein